MTLWMCELVLCVCVVLVGVCGIERVAKPVVFSYSSADLPHSATISHHYRGPVEPSADQQLAAAVPSAVAREDEARNGQSNVAGQADGSGGYQSTPMYYDDRSADGYSTQPTVGPATYNEPRQDYDYVTVNPDHHYPPSTVAYYDDRSMNSNQYYPPPSGEPHSYYQQQSYDYPTSRPELNYPSSTIPYYDDRPLDINQYNPNSVPSTISSPIYDDSSQDYDYSKSSSPGSHSTTPSYYDDRPVDTSQYDAKLSTVSPPVYNSNSQGYNYAVVNPDNSYHSTTVTYYNISPSKSYRNPPSSSPPIYDDRSHDYDYSTISPHFVPTRDRDYHSNPKMYGPSSTMTPHLDYKLGAMTNNVSVPNGYVPNNNFDVATTQVTNRFAEYPNQDQPRLPQFTGHATPPPFRKRTYTSTSSYYEDNEELISTTPKAEFESVREKLPPIEDYPPPNLGYITKPFKHIISRRRNKKRFGDEERAGGHQIKGGHRGDKVLQQPKFFAYSSDLLEDGRMGDMPRGDVEHYGEPDSTQEIAQEEHNHQEDHELDHHDEDHHKKKEEKYAKGGGQEHHAAHKASEGDEGDKGYKSSHKFSKGKKGHHDKEDHKGKYVDEKGKKGKKQEEGGHYGEHHQAVGGKKAAKYGESGEHKKGHSTKGEHNIHKMDEYMKKHEFYDEHHEGGDHEKFGGFMEAHAHKKGGKKKKGHHNSGSSHRHKGKKGHHEKGEKKDHHKGHKDAKGYDGHFTHHKKYGKKGGQKEGKMWGYSKGHPK